MNNYSQREKQEFERLLKKVLNIQKNLENNFYLGNAPAQRDRLVMEDYEHLRNYLNIPPEIKKENELEHKINLSELVEGLLQVHS